MARRKRKTYKVTPHVNPSAGWKRSTEFVAPSGRHLRPGTEFSVKGERGRFRFVEHVVTEKGAEWVSCLGGPKGCVQWRAFRPERIKAVHTKKTLMTASEAKALVAAKRAAKKGSQK